MKLRKPLLTFDLSSCLCAIAAALLAGTHGATTSEIILVAFLAANFGRSR